MDYLLHDTAYSMQGHYLVSLSRFGIRQRFELCSHLHFEDL